MKYRIKNDVLSILFSICLSQTMMSGAQTIPNLQPVRLTSDSPQKNMTIHLFNNQNKISAKSFDFKRENLNLILGYKTGGVIINNDDSINVRSFEFGLGLVDGNVNNWGSLGPLPLGCDWSYRTLPFLTVEYRMFDTFYRKNTLTMGEDNLRKFMLNVGVSGGMGLFMTLLPVPMGINGLVGLSSDFEDLYFRCRISYDLSWVSIGSGFYYNLTRKESTSYRPSYSFLEFSIHPWKSN